MVEKRKWQIGLIAWLACLTAILDTFFHILDPVGDAMWIVYGFGLLFGLAGAGAMDVEFNIKWEARQLQTITLGIIGGAALIMLQVVNGMLNTVFATTETSNQLTILAAVSEELLFTMALFGSLMFIAQGRNLHWMWAAVPTALIFALFHFFAYGLAIHAIVILFIGGIILRWTYVASRDIGAPMIAHMINNGLALALMVITNTIMQYWWVVGIIIILLILPRYLGRGK